MRTVLVLASSTSVALAEATRSFHSLGCRVLLSSRVMPDAWGEVGVDELRWVAEHRDGYPPGYWRGAHTGTRGERMWEIVKRHDWTVRAAGRADLLVALDPAMIYPVWQLAQQNPRAAARFGLHPALEAVRRGAVPREPESEAVDAAVRTSRRAPSRLRTAARRLFPRTEKTPDAGSAPVTDLAAELAQVEELKVAGKESAADSRVAQLSASMPGVRAQANLWGRLVAADLAAGRPSTYVGRAAAAEFALADHLLASGRRGPAVGSFVQGTRILFHRGLHLDVTCSPLADDPSGYVKDLHASTVYQAISVPRPREAAAAPVPTDRPVRVLLATNGNTNFIGVLQRYLEVEREVEVRLLEPDDLPLGSHWIGNLHGVVESELAGDGKVRREAEESLRPHLDWADVVFIDWCKGMAHFLTMVDPGETRVILRLHSYEAWTLWPHLVDFSRVDDMVFVSDHLRELTQAAVPRLAGSSSPAVHVLPNAMDLRAFALPKTADAQFTVALIGFHDVAKDVRWACEVMRELRRHDARYRLMLIGQDFHRWGTPAYMRYRQEATADLEALEAEGALVTTGRTEDVPEALRAAGTLLSSSVREGSPLGVLEGAASGAIPVVRNWPLFARSEFGPHALYPADWVVEQPSEAAARILEATQDAEHWSRESQRISAETIGSWDITATRRHFQKLIFGSPG